MCDPRLSLLAGHPLPTNPTRGQQRSYRSPPPPCLAISAKEELTFRWRKASAGKYDSHTTANLKVVAECLRDLRQAVEVFDELLQTCDKPSKCSTSCCKPAASRRSVRRAVANLRQAVEVFDELLQTCGKPSKCSTEHCKAAIHTDKKTSARIGARNREALRPRRTFSEERKRP